MKKTVLPALLVLCLFLAVPGATLAANTAELEKYQQAVRENPNNAKAHYNLGYLYESLDQNREAIAEYEQALRINPDYFAAHFNLGLVYKKVLQYRRAVSEFKKAILIRPGDAEIHYKLGDVYDMQGDGRNAISLMRKAESLLAGKEDVSNHMPMMKRHLKEAYDKYGYKPDDFVEPETPSLTESADFIATFHRQPRVPEIENQLKRQQIARIEKRQKTSKKQYTKPKKIKLEKHPKAARKNPDNAKANFNGDDGASRWNSFIIALTFVFLIFYLKAKKKRKEATLDREQAESDFFEDVSTEAESVESIEALENLDCTEAHFELGEHHYNQDSIQDAIAEPQTVKAPLIEENLKDRFIIRRQKAKNGKKLKYTVTDTRDFRKKHAFATLKKAKKFKAERIRELENPNDAKTRKPVEKKVKADKAEIKSVKKQAKKTPSENKVENEYTEAFPSSEEYLDKETDIPEQDPDSECNSFYDLPSKRNFDSLDDYFREHAVLNEWDGDGKDTHYAEREFLKKVFVPVLGLEGLRYLKPQYHFEDSSGGNRYIDFVLLGNENRFSIEILGDWYHHPKNISDDEYQGDINRTSSCSSAGFTITNFRFQEFDRGELLPAAQLKLRNLILNRKDSRFSPSWFGIPTVEPIVETTGATVPLEYVVIDIETTGFSPEKDRIIQISAIKLEGTKISPGLKKEVLEIDKTRPYRSRNVYNAFINPQRPIPPHIHKLTGITNRMVKNQPLEKDVLLGFLKFAGDRILIAHNGIEFDVKYLEACAKRNGIPFKNPLCIDTLLLSRKLDTNEKKHNLDAIIERKKICGRYPEFDKQRHNALVDAMFTYEVFADFARALREKGKDTLSETISNSF